MSKDEEVQKTSDIGGIAAYWNRNHKGSPTKRCPQCHKGTVITVDKGRLEVCVNCDYVTLTKDSGIDSDSKTSLLIALLCCGITLWVIYKTIL